MRRAGGGLDHVGIADREAHDGRFLLLLAGLLHPRRGEVIIGGRHINRPRPRTGLILQEYGLLPWATVYDNVALGLRIRRFYGPDGRHVPHDELVDRSEARTRVGR